MIVVAESAYSELITELETKDNVILIPERGTLYEGIRDHGDLHCLGIDGDVLLSQEVCTVFATKLKEERLKYSVIKQKLGCCYPETALLNAAILGNWLICNPKTVADEVLLLAKQHGKQMISIKQGYTRCTTLPLIDTCITDDPGIYKTLTAHGIGTLKIEPGHVVLSGHDYGFIGGCAGTVERTVYFNGDVTKHPDWIRMKTFCKLQGLEIWWINSKPLKDVGSVLYLKNNN